MRTGYYRRDDARLNGVASLGNWWMNGVLVFDAANYYLHSYDGFVGSLDYAYWGTGNAIRCVILLKNG